MSGPATIARLEKERDELVKVLRAVEWIKAEGMLLWSCPLCDGQRPAHAPDCALDAARRAGGCAMTACPTHGSPIYDTGGNCRDCLEERYRVLLRAANNALLGHHKREGEQGATIARLEKERDEMRAELAVHRQLVQEMEAQRSKCGDEAEQTIALLRAESEARRKNGVEGFAAWQEQVARATRAETALADADVLLGEGK